MDKQEAIKHLMSRNVSDIIVRAELEEKLKGDRKLTVYLGVDPSSPEIHLGHAVVLWKLREFQELGHKIILLIGDFTAQIGDPTGKSKSRIPLTHDIVLKNAEDYKEQASKIIKFDGKNPAEMRFNSQWLEKLTFAEVIKIAANFTVQQMIERDMYQERLKAGQPIGLHEFLYPLMQGYDSVEMDVDVEVGGNDQLFNIKAGRTLMEKMTGKKKVVFTCDLLTGSDGSKMSKSAGNIIPLDAGADDMFGKVMAIDDKLISEYARLCTEMTDEELATLNNRLKSGENPRDIKLDVAERITARYYQVASDARATWLNTDKSSAAEDITIKSDENILQLLTRILPCSASEARRLVDGGAVDFQDKNISSYDYQFSNSDSGILRVGKRRLFNITPCG